MRWCYVENEKSLEEAVQKLVVVADPIPAVEVTSAIIMNEKETSLDEGMNFKQKRRKKSRNFTFEEDKKIMKGWQLFGNNWPKIFLWDERKPKFLGF